MRSLSLDNNGIVHIRHSNGVLACEYRRSYTVKIVNVAQSSAAVTCLECIAAPCAHLTLESGKAYQDACCADCGMDLEERLDSYLVRGD